MILALVVLCIIIEAVFTALEVALRVTPRSRWKALADGAYEAAQEAEEPESEARARSLAAKAERLAAIADRPERLNLLFITVTTLSLWLAAALLTGLALHDEWTWWAATAAFTAVLFFAEVIPLLLAARHSETVAFVLSSFLERSLAVARPALSLLNATGGCVARIMSAGKWVPENPGVQVTTNELRTALAAAEEEGVIESEERAMLEGAFAFREKPVYTVMTSLEDVTGVVESTGLAEVLRVSLEGGHSRLPVFADAAAREHVAGILATKDLLRPLREGAFVTAQGVMRPAFFLDGETRIAVALERLRRERTLMAVVTRGETAIGIVTLEDLLEELVGEIEDEWDEAPALRVETAVTVENEAVPGNGMQSKAPRDMAFALVCERADEVTVREIERFWREMNGGLLRLRTRDGELATQDETIAGLAAEYLRSPAIGQTAVIGETRPESDDSADASETGDAPAEADRARADVELEVREVQNNAVQVLALHVVPAEQEIDSTISSSSTARRAAQEARL